MTNWPKGNQAALDAFYGDPDTNGDMLPDVRWESQNLTNVEPPYPLLYAGRPVSRIRVHRKCALSLTVILTKISKELSPEEIALYRLNEYGGCYNFRFMRGAAQLSRHSWACAIDLSPTNNSFNRRWSVAASAPTARNPMIPERVARIFEAAGWRWGARMWGKDAMHFEATSA